MIGRPYKYTGDTPAGFDCSGLVRYSYLTAGMDLPHGTSALRNITRSVGLQSARKGDLLFFVQEGKKYSHVGIYVGDDQFVHAPSTGGHVRKDNLTDPYWKKHYLDTRRFLSNSRTRSKSKAFYRRGRRGRNCEARKSKVFACFKAQQKAFDVASSQLPSSASSAVKKVWIVLAGI